MPRPILILIAVLAVVLVALIGVGMMDREVAVTHVERPLTNESAH